MFTIYFTNFTQHPSTTSLEEQFLFIHTMVTPVFITQIKEREDSFLSEQTHSLIFKDTTSMLTMTTNTYFPVETTKPVMMASNINTDDKVFPLEVYFTTVIGATSLTTTSCTPILNPVDHS